MRPFAYQAEHSREFATWIEENVAFESSGLSCSLLWSLSVDISFAVCSGRPFPRRHHRKSVLSSFVPPEPSFEIENVGFHKIWEEWEELSGFDSPPLLCQRPEQQRQEHETCDQRESHVHHTRSKRRSFFHSRSDLEKVGRHHHHAHTPHLALPLVSIPLFFSHSMSPQLHRLSDECELHNSWPLCVGPKTTMRNLFGAAGSAREGFSHHLIEWRCLSLHKF